MADTASDPQTQKDDALDLEHQVESLLADVTKTVDSIDSKLSGVNPPDATPAGGPLDDRAVHTEEGAAEADDAPDDTPAVTADEPITPDPEPSQEPQPDPAPTAEDVQAALEDALDSEAPDNPADPEDTGDSPEPEHTYGDLDSLDDELAALASNALDEDFGGEFEDADPIETPRPEPEPEHGAHLPTIEHPIASGDQPEEAAPEPEHSAPNTPEPAAPAAHAETAAETGAPPGRLRWGWLPPKPDWPQVYSRWRPLIIAWRHAVWFVPPLCGYLLQLATLGLIRAEPHARHAVAVVATPLSKRDKRTRSAIGWLALNTLFWASCLWIYILVGRSPAVPVSTASPATLDTGGEVGPKQASVETTP